MITLKNKYLDEKLTKEQKLELIRQTEQTDFSDQEDEFIIFTTEEFIEDYFEDPLEDSTPMDIVKDCIGFSCLEELAAGLANKENTFYLGINCIIRLFNW